MMMGYNNEEILQITSVTHRRTMLEREALRRVTDERVHQGSSDLLEQKVTIDEPPKEGSFIDRTLHRLKFTGIHKDTPRWKLTFLMNTPSLKPSDPKKRQAARLLRQFYPDRPEDDQIVTGQDADPDIFDSLDYNIENNQYPPIDIRAEKLLTQYQRTVERRASRQTGADIYSLLEDASSTKAKRITTMFMGLPDKERHHIIHNWFY
jgi:hypothetical protein